MGELVFGGWWRCGWGAGWAERALAREVNGVLRAARRVGIRDIAYRGCGMADSVSDPDAGGVYPHDGLSRTQRGMALPGGETLLPAAVFKTLPPDGNGKGVCQFLFPTAQVLQCLANHFGLSSRADSRRMLLKRLVRGREWQLDQEDQGAPLAKNVHTRPKGEHEPGQRGLSKGDESAHVACLVDMEGVCTMMEYLVHRADTR